MPQALVEVAAALLEEEGRLLIAQRPAGAHLAGVWEFPGGKREAGESWEACLARELREELGLEIEVGPEVRRVRHAYPDRTVEIRFFRCRRVGGDPRPLGAAAFAWVAPAELARYPFPPADAELVAELSGARGSR
ncbi:MAG TPA: (deoxy)nucleoside triphosphate pyrophosphohydrolase [Thermodesulfobacteriota bacterium]|nr:(deoxy)nucleoside triphosphate pyrophosphohydrolase [Thermodesulfobacteriota bacterium]